MCLLGPMRRIDDSHELGREVSAWNEARNRTANRINWQFTTSDARRKLRRLYPEFLRTDNHQKSPEPTARFNYPTRTSQTTRLFLHDQNFA